MRYVKCSKIRKYVNEKMGFSSILKMEFLVSQL